MSAPVARLSLRLPDGREEVSTLCEGTVVRIGRQAGNDILIPDKRVSRFHAVLNATGAGIVVSDLQSLNGTFVNGKRLNVPVDLQSGDAIMIGEAELTVELIFETGPQATPVKGDSPTTQSVGMRSLGVTVLVGDVEGYTQLAQAVPNEEVARMLERWFEMSTATIRQFGGEVDKYLGDAFLAIWKPDGQEDLEDGQRIRSALAKQAVHAASALLDNTSKLNLPDLWQYCADHPWRCRLSLNSGEALVGAMGSRTMRDFTVLGDTVNKAFRLNDAAKELGCPLLISSSTAKLVEGEVPVVSKGVVQLDGRPGQDRVFALG